MSEQLEVMETAPGQELTGSEIAMQASAENGANGLNVRTAEEARTKATFNFRKLVSNAIAQGIQAGRVDLRMEVTGAPEEAVREIRKELEDKGYKTDMNHIAKAQLGYTAKVLRVEF